MKKIRTFLFAVLFFLSFISCGDNSAAAAMDAGKNFLQQLYTVDQNTADTFGSLQSDEPSQMQAAIEMMNQKLQEKFSTMVTEQCLEDIITNRTYADVAFKAAQNGSTIQSQDIEMKADQVVKGYRDFTYTVVVIVTSKKDKSTKTEQESGIVALTSDNGVWKVNFIRFNKPNLLIR